MKQLALILVIFSLKLFSQDLESKSKEILTKAKRIYSLEKAAWIASDKFKINNFLDKTDLEGYVTYFKSDTIICIFYTKKDSIITEYVFKNDKFLLETLIGIRSVNTYEKDLISLKRKSIQLIERNEITNFRSEPDSRYNLIPILNNQEIICYLIQASENNKQLILGRDHILRFDKELNLIENFYNHKATQIIPFDNYYNNQEIKEAVHTHLLSDYIFETEIASLMLNRESLKIEKFVVITKNYKNFWDNRKQVLKIER